MAWLTHNPAFLSTEAMVERFVVRRTELDAILRVLRDNDGPSNQHVLIIAPRGRGKSMLVHRVVAELHAGGDLGGSWLPVVFGEESYLVSTIGELWLEALLHLAEELDDDELRASWERLRDEPDERRLAAAAKALLLDRADAQGKRLLLVIENLDTLLEDQLDGGDDDAWALRSVLLDEPRFMLLGTAVHRFPGVEQPDRPMFDLFRRVELDPLDVAETERLWGTVSGFEIGLQRAAAIRVLTGGNPRLVVLLASFAGGVGLKDLLDDLAALIDRNTDYFKHNIEALSVQQRRVFLALAELWAPATAADVARVCRLPVNKTSAILARLEKQGRVEIVETRGRTHVYQVAERLYNIYYLMRRRGGVEPRVRALLDFITHFYEPTEYPDLLSRVAEEAGGLAGNARQEHLLVMERMLAAVAEQRELLVAMARAVPGELWEGEDFPEKAREAVREPGVLAGLLAAEDGVRWVTEGEVVVERLMQELEVTGDYTLGVDEVELCERVHSMAEGTGKGWLGATLLLVLNRRLPYPGRPEWSAREQVGFGLAAAAALLIAATTQSGVLGDTGFELAADERLPADVVPAFVGMMFVLVSARSENRSEGLKLLRLVDRQRPDWLRSVVQPMLAGGVQPELIESTLSRLAAAGHPAAALDLLRDSPAAPRLEPLVVALSAIVGEPIDAPQEVREVAAHVRQRIDALAASDDPWTTPLSDLPLT